MSWWESYFGGRQHFGGFHGGVHGGVHAGVGESDDPRGHQGREFVNAAIKDILLCLPPTDTARCWLRQLCALPLASASRP